MSNINSRLYLIRADIGRSIEIYRLISMLFRTKADSRRLHKITIKHQAVRTAMSLLLNHKTYNWYFPLQHFCTAQ